MNYLLSSNSETSNRQVYYCFTIIRTENESAEFEFQLRRCCSPYKNNLRKCMSPLFSYCLIPKCANIGLVSVMSRRLTKKEAVRSLSRFWSLILFNLVQFLKRKQPLWISSCPKSLGLKISFLQDQQITHSKENEKEIYILKTKIKVWIVIVVLYCPFALWDDLGKRFRFPHMLLSSFCHFPVEWSLVGVFEG